jgi:hypothetical protein
MTQLRAAHSSDFALHYRNHQKSNFALALDIAIRTNAVIPQASFGKAINLAIGQAPKLPSEGDAAGQSRMQASLSTPVADRLKPQKHSQSQGSGVAFELECLAGKILIASGRASEAEFQRKLDQPRPSCLKHRVQAEAGPAAAYEAIRHR